jgi:hypothetical protein
MVNVKKVLKLKSTLVYLDLDCIFDSTINNNDMTTIKEQNGISITFNGRNTYMIVAKQEFGTSDVIYGRVGTERKANNLFNKILKQI